MPRTKIEPETSTPLDGATYNRFVAGVQPIQIELSEVNAHVQPSDAEQVTLQVESQFETKCLSSDAKAQTFFVEAQLHLNFLTAERQEVGQFRCVYRLSYKSSEPLSAGVIDQFVRRNAPLHAWPFMREIVLNLTQRFGWAGFMLPSFLIPPTPETSKPAPPKEGKVKSPTAKGKRAAKPKDE